MKALLLGQFCLIASLITSGLADKSSHDLFRPDSAEVEHAHQDDLNHVLLNSPNYKNLGRSGMPDDDEDDDHPQVYSRMIPHNEHILLNQIPGAESVLTCSREGELHNFWSSAYQCLVCACVRDYVGGLKAVCASCAGCMNPQPQPYWPDPTPPQPSTIYVPPYEPPTFAPQPYDDDVTCSPLPSGRPFENPLHPCQVCVCIESVNMYGKPDVQINCQENPQCVQPTPIVIPVVTDRPSPYCDQFPLHVLFPHPSDPCQSCQCSIVLSPLGVPEKQITCLLNRECVPPEPSTIIPYPFTTPQYPTQYPIIVTEIPQTPFPWIVSTPLPPRPGPLPGPMPHESCRPYVPNQPFQHPWDECQTCVCEEAITQGFVTIEVNCYTNHYCCLEPSHDLSPTPTNIKAQPPQPQPDQGKMPIINVPIVYPQTPGPIIEVPGSSQALANSVASANSYLGNGQSQSHASASADSYASNQVNPFAENPLIGPGYGYQVPGYQGMPGNSPRFYNQQLPGQGQSYQQAQAQAQASAAAAGQGAASDAKASSGAHSGYQWPGAGQGYGGLIEPSGGLNGYGQYPVASHQGYPGSIELPNPASYPVYPRPGVPLQPYPGSQSEAQSSANAASYAGGYPGYPGSQSGASAESSAAASADSILNNGLLAGGLPGSLPGGLGGGLSGYPVYPSGLNNGQNSASVEASAAASADSRLSNGYAGGVPGSLSGGLGGYPGGLSGYPSGLNNAQNSASAEASAAASADSRLSNGYLAGGQPGSLSGGLGGGLSGYPGYPGGSNNAQNIASASSQAKASAGNWRNGRSGKPDDNESLDDEN